MRNVNIKTSILWKNIDHVTVMFCKKDHSVYQCAHFYGMSDVSLQNLFPGPMI